MVRGVGWYACRFVHQPSGWEGCLEGAAGTVGWDDTCHYACVHNTCRGVSAMLSFAVTLGGDGATGRHAGSVEETRVDDTRTVRDTW